MRKLITLLLLINISFFATAGKLEKGFEALGVLDFFRAKDYFEKSLEKETAGAAFGLCKVFDSEKSQFFNVDSALKYITICDNAYPKSTEKDIEILTTLNINEETILQEQVFLASFFFKRATDENTIDAYIDFVTGHPEANEVEEAEKIIAHMAFLEAVEENTLEGYESFMTDFPEVADFDLAKKKFYLLEYQSMTRSSDAYGYQVFIKNRPNNPYIRDAADMVFKLYTENKPVESYLLFIEENPNNIHIEEAWEYVYHTKTSKSTAASISEFIIDYPTYPNPEELKKDLVLSKTYFIPAKKGELWGYVDTNGAWKITPKYQWVSSFTEGKATVGFMEKTVFINKLGHLIFSSVFDDASMFDNNVSIVEVDEYYGLINFRGDTVIPIIYDEIGEFSDGLIYAGKDGQYGYFDIEGKKKTPFIYQTAFDFQNNKAIIKENGKYGVINVLGQPVLQPIYEWIFSDSIYYVVKHQSKYGLISFNGDTLLPLEYDAISRFYDNRAIIAKEGTFQYIDGKSEIVIKEKFSFDESTLNYSQFHNGFARIMIDGKVGIIDINGKRVFPAIFADVGYYDQGLTPVNKTGLWGYANSKVKLVIGYEYKYANGFVNGLAIVENDTASGVINASNEVVIPFDYDEIKNIENTYFLVKKDGKYGLVDYQNQIIIPVENDKLVIKNNEIIELSSDGLMQVYWVPSKRVIYQEN